MRKDKLYSILLEIYREVYKKLAVDFDAVDKGDNWFLNYTMSEIEQFDILSKVISKYKLTRVEKTIIKSNYILGCSPKLPIK